jgi:maltooligosyltrehalose trehalohydrolase
LLVAENEPQHVRLVRPERDGGHGLDAVWNDDFHHSARVALTGRREAYYRDHRGAAQELVSAAKYGFLFQGQRYGWQERPRGTLTRGVEPPAFVCFLENHDQVANSAAGERLATLTGGARLRAMTALLLLGPWTPMLFQGQEHGSTRPFLYFADHAGKLASEVRRGRGEFLRQFGTIAAADMRDRLDEPGATGTFARCVLDPRERRLDAPLVLLHRDLLEVRRKDPVLSQQGAHGLDGAVIGRDAFVLRWFAPDGLDRLLVVNLGPDLRAGSLAEPLVAPPPGHRFALHLSTEAPRYGGGGTPEPLTSSGVEIVGQSALLLAPVADPGSS